MKVVIDGKNYVPEAKEEREIQFGDMYIRQHGGSFVVIAKEPESGRWLTLHKNGGQCYWKEDDIRKETRFSHNIFDDLTGEDLEEETVAGVTIKCDGNDINFADYVFGIRNGNADKLVLALRQLMPPPSVNARGRTAKWESLLIT